jgi:putative transcriptional regulator
MNNRIREFRAKLRLTQDDLARRTGVRRETIVFLEKSKYNPSLKLAYDIARVFAVSIEEVFIFTENPAGPSDEK